MVGRVSHNLSAQRTDNKSAPITTAPNAWLQAGKRLREETSRHELGAHLSKTLSHTQIPLSLKREFYTDTSASRKPLQTGLLRNIVETGKKIKTGWGSPKVALLGPTGTALTTAPPNKMSFNPEVMTRATNGTTHIAKALKQSSLLRGGFGIAEFAVGANNMSAAWQRRKSALADNNTNAVDEANRLLITNGSLAIRGALDVALAGLSKIPGGGLGLNAPNIAKNLKYAVGATYVIDGTTRYLGAKDCYQQGLLSSSRKNAEENSGIIRAALGVATTRPGLSRYAYRLSGILALSEAALSAYNTKSVDLIADLLD